MEGETAKSVEENDDATAAGSCRFRCLESQSRFNNIAFDQSNCSSTKIALVYCINNAHKASIHEFSIKIHKLCKIEQ